MCIKLCENALEIIHKYLPIERGRICLNGLVDRLLSAQIAEIGTYCADLEPIMCLDSGARSLFSA